MKRLSAKKMNILRKKRKMNKLNENQLNQNRKKMPIQAKPVKPEPKNMPKKAKPDPKPEPEPVKDKYYDKDKYEFYKKVVKFKDKLCDKMKELTHYYYHSAYESKFMQQDKLKLM